MPAATSPYQPLQTNHSKPTTLVLAVVLVTFAVTLVVTPAANAQSTIPLGTISVVNDPVPCSTVSDGSHWYSGMTCFGATINCSNIDSNIANINLIFGYVGPTGPTSNGTIVFFTGDGGVASTLGATNAFAADYVGSYTIVYVDWGRIGNR
jgi:hypothetical protein